MEDTLTEPACVPTESVRRLWCHPWGERGWGHCTASLEPCRSSLPLPPFPTLPSSSRGATAPPLTRRPDPSPRAGPSSSKNIPFLAPPPLLPPILCSKEPPGQQVRQDGWFSPVGCLCPEPHCPPAQDQVPQTQGPTVGRQQGSDQGLKEGQ